MCLSTIQLLTINCWLLLRTKAHFHIYLLDSTFSYGKWAIAAALTVAPRPGSVKCALILTPIPCFGVSFKTVYIMYACKYLCVTIWEFVWNVYLAAYKWCSIIFISRSKTIAAVWPKTKANLGLHPSF